MRIFKHAILVAAVLTAGLSSCSNEDHPAAGDPAADRVTQSVTLKIGTGNPATYAEETSMINAPSVINPDLPAHVYFLNGNVITDHFAITAGAQPGTGGAITIADLTGESGYTFPTVSGSADKVYIAVNKTSDMTMPAGGTLSDIESAVVDIEQFTAINTVTMTGVANINRGTTPVSAEVWVAPVVARFEISKVEYDATAPSSEDNVIESFTLDGIFVNNYHATMGLGFAPIAGQLMTFTNAVDYDEDNFPDPLSDIFEDKEGETEYTPAEDLVWAYQFFPVNQAGYKPMLVIKISDIEETVESAQFTEDQFISVNKFFEAGTDPLEEITQFERNKVYKINTIKFSNRNLSTTPGTVLQDVAVTVKVSPWSDMTIIPEL